MRSKLWLPLVGAVAVGLSVGCSKKPEAPVPVTATEAASQSAASATPKPVAAPASSSPETRVMAEANSQIQDLELQVDAYQKIYKRKPESLEQMVREGFLRALPPAPPGKRYSLDPATGRVSLVP